MGSEKGSKLGCLDSDMQYVGEKVLGCGLGVFNLVKCNGPCQHIGLGIPRWDFLGVLPRLWILRGQKGESKLGPVANNGENIANTAQVRLHNPGHTACRGSLIWV